LTSRWIRWGEERGSIAYSAVTHPLPLPFIHFGTPSSIVAVQITRVSPIPIKQEPSAYGIAPSSIETGRN
jgi:hypothetical protein